METAFHEFELRLQLLTLTPMEAPKDPNTKAQREKLLARVATTLRGTNINNVTITGTGIALGTPREDGDDFDTPLDEAAFLVERMVNMQCSVRQLYQLPHTCTRAHPHHGFWQRHLIKSRRHHSTMRRGECPNCTGATLPSAAPYVHEDQGDHGP